MTVLKTSGTQKTVYAKSNTANTSVAINCVNDPASIEVVWGSIDRATLNANDVHIQLKNATTNTVIGETGWGVNDVKEFTFPRGLDLPKGAVYRINLLDDGVVVENHLFAVYMQ